MTEVKRLSTETLPLSVAFLEGKHRCKVVKWHYLPDTASPSPVPPLLCGAGFQELSGELPTSNITSHHFGAEKTFLRWKMPEMHCTTMKLIYLWVTNRQSANPTDGGT